MFLPGDLDTTLVRTRDQHHLPLLVHYLLSDGAGETVMGILRDIIPKDGYHTLRILVTSGSLDIPPWWHYFSSFPLMY